MVCKVVMIALVCVVGGVRTHGETVVEQPGNQGNAGVESLVEQLLSEEGEAYRKRVAEFAALPPEVRAKSLAVLDARPTPLAKVIAAALRCRVESPEMVAAFESAIAKARATPSTNHPGTPEFEVPFNKMPREVFDQWLVSEAVAKGLDSDPYMLQALARMFPAFYPRDKPITREDAACVTAMLAAADKLHKFGPIVELFLRTLARVPEQPCDEAFMQSYRRYRERGAKTEWHALQAVIALQHLDTPRALPIAEAVRAWEHERMSQLPISPWNDESALDETSLLLREQLRLRNTKGAFTNHARLAQIKLEIEETRSRWGRKGLWETIERVVKELREKAEAVPPVGSTPTPEK